MMLFYSFIYLFCCCCFPTFWCFKGLSQRFTKTQGNISKRAALEKKRSTLKKDKEDLSKCYLRYPKPPFLKRKWENRDINVIERTNIPKISKLDDIVIRLRLLNLFFDEVLVDMILGYINLHIHREKADISFEITN